MHRLASEGYKSRRRKKLLGKSNWFKQKNQKKYTFSSKPEAMRKKSKPKSEELETVTVMFVSQTPNGELAKNLQKAENEIAKFTGERVRICERGGKTIRGILHKSNPWHMEWWTLRKKELPSLHKWRWETRLFHQELCL